MKTSPKWYELQHHLAPMLVPNDYTFGTTSNNRIDLVNYYQTQITLCYVLKKIVILLLLVVWQILIINSMTVLSYCLKLNSQNFLRVMLHRIQSVSLTFMSLWRNVTQTKEKHWWNWLKSVEFIKMPWEEIFNMSLKSHNWEYSAKVSFIKRLSTGLN